jgi:hypothetical protein
LQNITQPSSQHAIFGKQECKKDSTVIKSFEREAVACITVYEESNEMKPFSSS